MNLTIIAVGKIKKGWMADGISDYADRLKRFGKISILEVADEKIPERYSEKQAIMAITKEGERMLSRWPKDALGVALHPAGKTIGSEGLAKLMDTAALQGQNHLCFAIGGSCGLAPSVLEQCQHKISFGPNTFPHQLFRVMLLEQIYRGEKIRSGQPYHK
ncbi:MAG: 23S rRNA (pseudouridine(1915)-N(3))-methyltransferase RlmH [Spirochaetales bacterium]|nr:23S rRNA (pseudouridine(1915)-N(3))-methyltransferase RlmH [Spirochaetales bacterium]